MFVSESNHCAALYMRMSTDKQENSIDSQRQVLRDFARRNRYEIAREYIDEGISGRKADKRPAFIQMIEDAPSGDFDTVLIFDSSRFARNLEESLVYKSALKKHGVQIVSATEPAAADEDVSLLTDALMGAVNEMFSRKLSKAVKRGMAYRVERGYIQTAPPYGYSREFKDGIPQIDPEQAAVVRLIFERFTTDIPSFIGIVRFLNENGYRTRRGKFWDVKLVKCVLSNITYIGLIPWSDNDGEAYKGLQEPIVDRAIFDNAQELYNRRLTPRRPRDLAGYRHWLSGLIFCAHCGKVMAYNHHKNPKHCIFRCINNAKGLCLPRNAANVIKAESVVLDAIRSLAGGSGINFENVIVKPKSNNGERERLSKHIARLETRLERHKAAYESGVDTLDEYKANKTRVLAEISESRAALSEVTERPDNATILATLQARAQGLADYLEKSDDSTPQKSTAARSLIHKVIWNHSTGDCSIYFGV